MSSLLGRFCCRRGCCRGRVHDLADTLDEGLGLEGLGDLSVGAGGGRTAFVEGLKGAGQEQDGDMREGRILFDRLANLVATLAGHDDVCENDIGLQLAGADDRVVAVVGRNDLDVLVCERESDELLDDDRIVGQEKCLGHGFPPFRPGRARPVPAYRSQLLSSRSCT